jgi:hypothetical protein
MVRAMRLVWSLVALAACAGGTPAASVRAAGSVLANQAPPSTLVPCPEDADVRDQIQAIEQAPDLSMVEIDACVPIDVGRPAWAVLWRINGPDTFADARHREVLGVDGSLIARAADEPLDHADRGNFELAATDLDGDRIDDWLEIDFRSEATNEWTLALRTFRVAGDIVAPLAAPVEVGRADALDAYCEATLATNGGIVSVHVEALQPPRGCLAEGDHAIRYANGAITVD